MSYLICGKCKAKRLEITTLKDLEKRGRNGLLPVNSAISPELIMFLIRILSVGGVISFFINKNKRIAVCHSCGLYMSLTDYKKKYGDPK